MNCIRFGFLIASGVVGSLGLSAAPQLSQIVPASAPFVLHVRDISELRTQWNDTGFAKAWEDPEIRKFLAPTIDALGEGGDSLVGKIKADTGMEPEEFFGLFSGEAIFAVKDFASMFRGEGDASPQMLFAIDCGSSTDKIKELIAKAEKSSLDEDEEVSVEEFQGETLHVTLKAEEEGGARTERQAWAVVDSFFLVGEPKAVLQEAIVAIKRGGVADPIAEHPALATLYRKSPDTHAVVHVGLDGIVGPALELLESTAGQTDANGNPTGPAAKLAQFGLTPRGLFQALGLDALRSLDFSVAFRERETVIEGDFSWTEKRGLLRMAAVGEPPVVRPDFVPDSWVSASVDNFSLGEAVNALMTTLADVSPAIEGMVRQQLAKANEQLGIDIERDFFGSMGAVMIGGYAVPAGGPTQEHPLDQFFAIKLSNPDAFRTAFDAILGGSPLGQMLQGREYLGETIRETALPNGKSFAVAITREYFMVSVGGASMVESALQGMQGGSARPFWKKPEVVKALQSLPEGASSIVVADLGQMMGMIVDFLAENAAASNEPAADEGGDDEEGGETPEKMPFKVDPAARPSAETIAKYWSTMGRGLYQNPNGFHVIIKLDNGR